MAQKLKGTLSFIVKVSAALNCLCFLGNSGGKLCSGAFFRHHFIPAAAAHSVRNIFTWHLVQRVPPALRQHVLDCHCCQCEQGSLEHHTDLLGRDRGNQGLLLLISAGHCSWYKAAEQKWELDAVIKSGNPDQEWGQWKALFNRYWLGKTVWVSDVISVQLLMKEILKGNEWRQLWLLLSQPLSLF